MADYVTRKNAAVPEIHKGKESIDTRAAGIGDAINKIICADHFIGVIWTEVAGRDGSWIPAIGSRQKREKFLTN